MENKTLAIGLKKAVIELLILKLLSEHDMYGYQITQELKKRSNGQFTLLEGSMYPILYRLSDNNYISSYVRQTGIRQTRTYYHIEALGIDRLQNMMLEFQKSMQIIEFLLDSNEGDTYES